MKAMTLTISSNAASEFAVIVADLQAQRDRAKTNGQEAIASSLDAHIRRVRELEASGGSPDEVTAAPCI